MNYLELAQLLAPEAALVIAALVVLGLDLRGRGRSTDATRRRVALGASLAGCAIAFAWLLVVRPEGAEAGGMIVSDPLVRLVKLALLILTAGTLVFSSRIRFTPHLGEYAAVILLGAVGMMLIASSENVLMMFLALELASLSLYILAAFDKGSGNGAEAALKYFLFGGMAGAFLLFGLSMIYGATGAIEFRRIAEVVAGDGVSPLFLGGLVMAYVGLGFKVASAPFHFWAPDAYQGAPTPVAGFIAAGSKVAAFFVLAKFTAVALGGAAGSSVWGMFSSGWSPVVALLAALSMVWGNVAALAQNDVKRLLAYSAIAHAGYTLVAVLAGGGASISAVVFYAITYALTTLGAFGAVGLVEQTAGGSDLSRFAGLARRSPVLAVCLAVFFLSLAGIPPLAGFFGKLYLFYVALSGGNGGGLGLIWLVGLGAATTCVSFYYYLRVLKAVFVSRGDGGEIRDGAVGGAELATVAVIATAVLVLGCAPDLLLGPLRRAVEAAGF